jgi:predicted nucleic acid-binding protein
MASRGAARLPLGLVYDTGALIAAEGNDRRVWALHARAMQRGVLPVVPAGCVVEAWRGSRQTGLSRLLEGCEIEPLSADPAKRAGAIRRTLDDVGPVDATVVESAVRRGAAVVTSDRSDIVRLAGAARRRVQIIDI